MKDKDTKVLQEVYSKLKEPINKINENMGGEAKALDYYKRYTILTLEEEYDEAEDVPTHLRNAIDQIKQQKYMDDIDKILNTIGYDFSSLLEHYRGCIDYIFYGGQP